MLYSRLINFINISMLKTFTLILLFFTLLLFPRALLASEQISATGNYPNFAITNKVILKPHDWPSIPPPCKNGTFFVNSFGEIQSCDVNEHPALPIWFRDPDPGFHVYPLGTAANATHQISIGALNINPFFLINIMGNFGGVSHQIVHEATNIDGNMATFIFTAGPASDTLNNLAFIDFHIGNQGLDYDASIVTSAPLNGPKGLYLRPGTNPLNFIFMDQGNTRTGINTNVPEEVVDVAGNTETNELYLNDGTNNDARLKVGYTASGGGGYYAVYAP